MSLLYWATPSRPSSLAQEIFSWVKIRNVLYKEKVAFAQGFGDRREEKMKSLKEMTGVEAIELFAVECGPDALSRLAYVFGKDVKFLSPKVLGLMMDKVFCPKLNMLIEAEGRKHFTGKYLNAFFAALGIDNQQEIDDLEIVKKSLEIGGSETAELIFIIILNHGLAKIEQLPAKIKKLLLERKYGKDITFEDLFATETYSFADPTVEAATKLLFEA